MNSTRIWGWRNYGFHKIMDIYRISTDAPCAASSGAGSAIYTSFKWQNKITILFLSPLTGKLLNVLKTQDLNVSYKNRGNFREWGNSKKSEQRMKRQASAKCLNLFSSQFVLSLDIGSTGSEIYWQIKFRIFVKSISVFLIKLL